jgi:hypothetical protein
MALASCFETHRSAARLLGRAVHFGETKPTAECVLGRSEAPTCGCRKRALKSAPCFRPVLYRELCNCSACRGTEIESRQIISARPCCIGTTRWASEEATCE